MAQHEILPAGDASKGWSDLTARWDHRSGMAASWLEKAKSVADIGCGTMALRDHLAPSVDYIGIDIAKRDSDTIVIDLDNEKIPSTGAEASAALGVIEYLNYVDDFLDQLNNFKFSVISYNHKSIKDIAWTLRLKPKRVTWINHFSVGQFRDRINRAGLEITRSKRIRMGESLYEVRPVHRD